MSRTRWLDISLFTRGRERRPLGHWVDITRSWGGRESLLSCHRNRADCEVISVSPHPVTSDPAFLPSLSRPCFWPPICAEQTWCHNLFVSDRKDLQGRRFSPEICLNFNSLCSWYTETSKIKWRMTLQLCPNSAAIKILQIINWRIFNFTQQHNLSCCLFNLQHLLHRAK